MNNPDLFEPTEIWKGYRIFISLLLGVSLLPLALSIFILGINSINEYDNNKREIKGRILDFVEIEDSSKIQYNSEGKKYSVNLPSIKTCVRLSGVDSLINVSFPCFFDSTFRDTIKNKDMYAVINMNYKADLVKFDNKVFYSKYNKTNKYISSSWMLFACFLFLTYAVLGILFRFRDLIIYIKRNPLWFTFLVSMIILGFIYGIYRLFKLIYIA